MFNKPLAFYEARITLGLMTLFPLLGLPGYALVSWLIRNDRQAVIALADLIRAFEIVLPLSAGLLAPHLMTLEHDDQFDELRFSYPEPSWRVPFLRTVNAFIMLFVSLVIGLAAFFLLFGQFDVSQVILTALPPAFYLMGLSILFSTLTLNYWVTTAMVVGYWFLDLQLRGGITKVLFLFDHTWALPGVSYTLNRCLLVCMGLLFLAAMVWVNAFRRRRIQGGGAG